MPPASLASLVTQLENRASLREIWKNNRASVHQILTAEFDLAHYLSALGLLDSQSQIAPIYQSFQRGINTSHLLVKYPKVCPKCIEESGCCKYEWAVLPVLTCCKHQTMLVDTHPNTGKRLSWYRQHLNKFDGDSTIIKIRIGSVPSTAIKLSRYIEALLFGYQKNIEIPAILYDLEFNESLSLIPFIAHYQTRLLGETFKPVAMENANLGQHYRVPGKCFSLGQTAFMRFLANISIAQ